MTKLADQILKHLQQRPDIWLDNGAPTDGEPGISGVQLRRVVETSMVGAESYHPFKKVEFVYYGQAFVVETNLRPGKSSLTKPQLTWRDAFENCGGVYIEARSLADVTDVLGAKEPGPWSEYQDRETRVGRVLNQQ